MRRPFRNVKTTRTSLRWNFSTKSNARSMRRKSRALAGLSVQQSAPAKNKPVVECLKTVLITTSDLEHSRCQGREGLKYWEIADVTGFP